jgi:glycosyltransferase involved in cell wall biosynthesis
MKSGGDALNGAAQPRSAQPVLDEPRLRLSVIVAVRNGADVLPRCLAALARSEYPRDRWELIVVDDGSSDDSPLIAAEYADLVIRLPHKARGPAYARNRASEAARAPILVYVDADVCVHSDVLGRFDAFFTTFPWVSGVFGSYDARPSEPGLVSQFRNLLHHFVHQSNPGEAETFWTGCGALRREAFHDVEMFDEWHYSRPGIEDIDLGRRLRRAGHRIVLRPDIQCTHLKRWTFGGMLRTDFRSRGVPWMRALLQEQAVIEFHALNLRYKERLCTAAALVACFAALGGLVFRSSLWLAVFFGLGALVFLLNLRFYRFLWEVRGTLQMLASIPLHFLFYATAGVAGIGGYLAHIALGEPAALPEVEAESAMDLELWPPCPRRPESHLWRPISAGSSPVEDA